MAILAHRSILNGNCAYDIPDFRREEDRVKFENDWETPFYGSDGSLPTVRAAADENAENQSKIDNYESVIRSITGK